MHSTIRNLEPRILITAMIATVMLFAALAFKWMVWPQARLYQQSLHDRTMLRRVTESGADLAQQLKSMEGDVEVLDHKIHGDMADLPAKRLESFVIGRLQQVSTRNNVQLLSVTPRSGETVKMFQEALFEVSISGTYFDLFNWLRDLSRELGFVVVRQYTITPTDSETKDPTLTAGMTIVSYRQAEAG